MRATTTRAKSRHTTRAPRWVRVAVWALFAVVAAGSASAAGVWTTPDETISSQVALGDDASLVGPVAGPQLAAINDADQDSNYVDPNQSALIQSYKLRDGTEPLDLLPAWRWRDDTQLFASYGWQDIPESGLNSLAGMMFSMAGWVWWLVLGCLELAMSISVLDSGGRAINDGFVRLSDSLMGSGLIWLPLIGALIYAARASLKGQGGKPAVTLIATIVPIAALIALTNMASPPVDDVDGSAPSDFTPAEGGPVWLAKQGVFITDEIATGIGTGLGALPDSRPGVAKYAEMTPSCAAYDAALYDSFSTWQDQKVEGTSSSLKVVSYLWDRSFLTNWRSAQYGGAKGGTRIYCHQLEANGGISRAEQATIAMIAGYPEMSSAKGTPGLSGSGVPHITNSSDQRDPFVAINMTGKGYQSALFAWAGCVYKDGWYAQEAWAHAGELNGEENDCKAWYLQEGAGNDEDGDHPGVGKKLLQWGDSLGSKTEGTVAGPGLSTGDSDKVLPYVAGEHDDLSDVRHIVKAFRGDNSGARLMAGLITLLTSVIYLYVLGGVAIGSLLAQLGLAIMLILLPGTLFLLALPTKGDGRHPAGKRFLRMTGAFLAAKLVMMTVLILLLQCIIVLEGVVGGGGGGIINMVIPIVAFLLIRKIIKEVGVGNITSPMGAIGLTTAAAMASADAKDGKSFRKSAARTQDKFAGAPGRAVTKARKTARQAAESKAGAWAIARGKGAVSNAAEQAGMDGQKLRDKMAEAKSTAAQLRTMSGAARLFAERSNNPELAAKAQGWADKITGFNPKRLEGANAAWAQREEQKEIHQTLGGLKGAARSAAMAELTGSYADRLRNAQQLERDKDGNALLTADGSEIFGFAAIDAQGNKQMLTAAQAGFDPLTGRARDGIEILTSARSELSDIEARVAADQLADKLGLDGRQILASTNGLAPVAALQYATGLDRARIPRCDNVQDTVELARDSVHYLSDDYKRLLSRAGLSESARNRAVHQLMIATGGVDAVSGAKVDFAKMNGIDLDTTAGVIELERHLAGEESAFDGIVATVSSSRVAAIIADARSYDRRSGGGKPLVAKNVEVVANVRSDVEATAASRSVELDTIKLKIDSTQTMLESINERSAEAADLSKIQSQVQAVLSEQQSILAAAQRAAADAASSNAPNTAQLQAVLNRARQEFEAAAAQVTSTQSRVEEVRVDLSGLQRQLSDAVGDLTSDEGYSKALKLICEVRGDSETLSKLADLETQVASGQVTAGWADQLEVLATSIEARDSELARALAEVRSQPVAEQLTVLGAAVREALEGSARTASDAVRTSDHKSATQAARTHSHELVRER